MHATTNSAIGTQASCAYAHRKGNLESMQGHLAQGLPALPQSAKKALGELLQSRPSFHPTSAWTRVSQFHGPQVSHLVLLQCYSN